MSNTSSTPSPSLRLLYQNGVSMADSLRNCRDPKVEPTVPIYEQYPDLSAFPAGQVFWNENVDDDDKEEDIDVTTFLEDQRASAEVHRQVRRYAQSFIKPGIKLYDMCSKIEDKVRELIREEGDGPLDSGMAFPTGCSLNHVAAHYTPNPGDDIVLQYNDVMKLDFGVQRKGGIIDCAFTVAFDPQFDRLLEASKEATNAGIAAVGVDARLREIGGAIQEVMESYEVELGDKTHRIRPIRNLGGHNIERYRIHAGKYIPLIAPPPFLVEFDKKLGEGEVVAIETFASTGNGVAMEIPQSGPGKCSHYMQSDKFSSGSFKLKVNDPEAKKVLGVINRNFSTLAFCPRFLEHHNEQDYEAGLEWLCKHKAVEKYPPLADIPGSYTSQYEHTVYIGENSKEVISRGDDY